jgi:hypothetical protein
MKAWRKVPKQWNEEKQVWQRVGRSYRDMMRSMSAGKVKAPTGVLLAMMNKAGLIVATEPDSESVDIIPAT